MTRAVLPCMIERACGSIINIGSTAGLVGDYMLPVYSAMKGAVHSFTTVLAKEVGQHGIRVNAVAPYATFAKSADAFSRSEEHTSELQSLMRISYAVFCLKKKKTRQYHNISSIKSHTK